MFIKTLWVVGRDAEKTLNSLSGSKSRTQEQFPLDYSTAGGHFAPITSGPFSLHSRNMSVRPPDSH